MVHEDREYIRMQLEQQQQAIEYASLFKDKYESEEEELEILWLIYAR